MTVLQFIPRKIQPPLGPNGFPLRVVILEYPYESLLNNPEASQLFPRLLALKINGYKAVYPAGVLPMDTADFIGNHIILAEETSDGLIPHTAFKSVTLSLCKKHFLRFPAYGLLEIADQPAGPAYKQQIDDVIQSAALHGEEVGYNGSWTVSKQLQKMKDKFDFRSASMTFMTQYYRSYNIKHIIAAASAKYKVDHLKIFMGYDYFKVNGDKLPPLNLVPYGSEPFYMMHLQEFAQQTIDLCNEPLYKYLWENRITITAHPEEIKKAA